MLPRMFAFALAACVGNANDDPDPSGSFGTPDCEGGELRTFHVDADRDSYGGSETMEACVPGEGVADNADDCDDSDSAVRPGAPELCNGRDDDCDEVEDTELEWYADADGDGYGGAYAGANACAEPGDFIADGTDCDDDEPRVHPGAIEDCNGRDDDCDGAERACAYDGDYDLRDADAVRTCSVQAQVGFVLAVGDVTGDGTGDLLLGKGAALTAPTSGAYVVPGPVAGEAELEETAPFEISSATISDAGSAIAVGDLSGDGIGDAAFGAGRGSAGDNGVYLVFGPVTSDVGLDAEADARLLAPVDGFGVAVAVADVSGDDQDDVIVGNPFNEGPTHEPWQTPSIVIATGPFDGASDLASVPVVEIDSTRLRLTGEVVVAGEDIDGDGIGDVVASARGDESRGVMTGGVFVLYGPVVITDIDDADGFLRGAAEEAFAGDAIATGDFDGDGFADVAVTSAGVEPGGTVSIVTGPAGGDRELSEAEMVLVTDEVETRLGAALASGDVEADGRVELVLGSPWNDGVPDGTGVVHLLSDPPIGRSRVEDVATATFWGVGAGDLAGSGLALGDLDGNGFDELVIGAPGLGGDWGGGVYVEYSDH